MTCPICEAEFCWLCGREISDLHYLRYFIEFSWNVFDIVLILVHRVVHSGGKNNGVERKSFSGK